MTPKDLIDSRSLLVRGRALSVEWHGMPVNPWPRPYRVVTRCGTTGADHALRGGPRSSLLAMSPRPEKLVALLRAINVGGKRLVPMTDLATLFASLGALDVKTYIQSGNVVFTPPAKKVLDAATLGKAIAARFGFDVPVVVRAHAQLRRVFENNPFLARGVDRSVVHVGFLSGKPTSSSVAKIDPARSPGDEVALRGEDLFLHLPKGVGKTKLTVDYLDRVLGVTTTVRNWNTVEKLVALTAG